MEKQRILIKAKNPNPLFKSWLKEWIEDAEKKKSRISKTYKKALDTLEKYPLTLFTGRDCAILECFGPKICQMLDDKLEVYLRNLNDVDSRLCFKDKIAALQKRENNKINDLIRNIEAASLTDDDPQNISTNLEESHRSGINLSQFICEDEQENVSPNNYEPLENIVLSDNEVLVDNSDNEVSLDDSDNLGDSEDSIDRLVRKYESNPTKKQEPKKRKLPEIDRIIDISFSPVSSKTTSKPISFKNNPPATDISHGSSCSPVSTTSATGTKLKRFKTFNGVTLLAGPSHASSPISKFLDVETANSKRKASSPLPPVEEEDEFDKLVAKYNFISPIVPLPPTVIKSPSKEVKRKKIEKPVKLNFMRIQSFLNSKNTQTAPLPISTDDNDDEELKLISIDDINTKDYDIILLVDIQETSGKSKASTDETLTKLRKSNVENDVRKLNVGDFLWIAKHKTEKNCEYVLPYIIERKRIDDLSSSIKDGRFHEQKFRLKQCGIENVIYLIENQPKLKAHCGLPFTTLLQASTNTQIHSNFQVKFTESHDHTILYLTVMTSFVENIFKSKTPIKFKLMDFDKFNKAAVKQRKCTVRETFIKQLLVLKGLSVDIALEITNNYSTPMELCGAYRRLSKKDGENLLTALTIGDLKRKIPINVSKTIYQVYTSDTF